MKRAWWLAAVLTPLSAGATWSVAATEQSTQRVGGAVSSCVGALDLKLAYASAPGHGVVHAQASFDPMLKGRSRAVELLDAGVLPTGIVSEITAPGFDTGAETRQYGIVDLEGRAAGFTGALTLAFAADRQGHDGGLTWSVQGNILTSQNVLDQTQAAFQVGCDLPDRLMRALEAGGQRGEGDSRCTPNGLSADSAFLRVDEADGGVLVLLSVQSTEPDASVVVLRQRFDEWRATHPCPAAPQMKAPQTTHGCGCGASGSPFLLLLLIYSVFSGSRGAGCGTPMKG